MFLKKSAAYVRAVAAGLLLMLALAQPGWNQCGNVDGDPGGGVDIGDASAMIDYLFLSGNPPAVYGDAEMDGHANVNVSDFNLLLRHIFCDFIPLNGCFPLGAPLAPPKKKGHNVWLGQNTYPADVGTPTPMTVQLYFSTKDDISTFAIPFQVLIDGLPATIVPGTLVTYPVPALYRGGQATANNVLIWAVSCMEAMKPTKQLLAEFQILATTSSSTPRPIKLLMDPYPTPLNPGSGDRVHTPLFIKKGTFLRVSPDSLEVDGILPAECDLCYNASMVGEATITDSADLLVVDNIGPSGNDGVSFDAPNADSIHIDFITEDLASSGSEMSVQIIGTVPTLARGRAASPADVVLTGWKIANAGGPLQLVCDFNPLGDPNVLIAAYNGAALQGSTSVSGGGVVAVATPAGFGNPLVKSLWMVKSNPCTFEIEFDRQATVTTVNSQVYVATRVRFIALGQTIPIQQIKTAQVTGKNTRLVIAKFFARVGGCCHGFSGNVDCDLLDGIDISDLSTLIDYLYITFTPLCCPKAANCDGDPGMGLDISDLSALIDYLYITFTPTAPCQ